jgi:flagellar biosynthesis chaperone FliJ
MFHTDAQVEFKEILRRFSDTTYQNYGTHAYATGYLESMAVQMLAVMSKREQQGFIRAMQAAVEQQQATLAKERV